MNQKLSSSLKIDGAPKKERGHLSFQKRPSVDIQDRDYGLISASGSLTKTIFPMVTTPFHYDSISLQSSVSDMDAGDIIKKSQSHLSLSVKTHDDRHVVPANTPHVSQGKIVNPKIHSSMTRGLSFNLPFRKNSTHSTRNSIIKYVPIGTPHPRKKIVLDPIYLARRLTAVSEDLPQKIVKKVVFITPSLNLLTGSSTSSESNSHFGSSRFDEQRRLFNLGEFTIAKNGKKMSEMPMSKSVEIEDIESIFSNDRDATTAMEMYMRKQGITQIENNLVTGLKPIRNTIHIEALSRNSSQMTQIPIVQPHRANSLSPIKS